MIRKTIFWTHLVCGVTAGLVILMMSVTGVLLTYERQLLDWADRDLRASPGPGETRQSIESLIAAVKLDEPDFAPTSITIHADPEAPVAVAAGRSGSRYVNPYSGEVLGEGSTGLAEFFGAVTGWHRWFNASGPNRGPWRAITGASNLMFLFLIVSGMYLWLPRMFKWAAFKTRLLFSASALSSGHARDFNWHHVIGIWTAIPLAVVVATAVIFSYSWGNDLVYRAFGEDPPRLGPPPGPAPQAATQGSARPAGGPGRSGGEARTGDATAKTETAARAALSLDELVTIASAHLDEWESITVNLPRESDNATVSFSIDQGNGGQPQRRHTLSLDARTGTVSAWQPFQSLTAGRQTRSWARFLHTGEALGIVGQTVAGLVSLTSVVMIWTGLALAYRRLIVPVINRRRRNRPA